MSSTSEKLCQCRHKKYFTTYIVMLFQSNGTRKYLRNNKIMSKFSRDTTGVAFCRSSFILWSQCAVYFRACSISRLFLCAMNINEPVISITSTGSRHGKLTVRQCYGATDGICTKFQDVLYLSICRRHVRIFYRYVDIKKRSWQQPQ